MATRTFIPAAGHDRWLPFYDIGTKLLGASTLRRALIAQADVQEGHRVLDIGCGTGTLAVMLKTERPDVAVVGLDPDALALERATDKARRAHVDVEFVRGFADAIPHAQGSFDRVVSSLMLHHLTDDEKVATLRDVHRVLRPGGSFHLLDFTTDSAHRRGLVARLLHREAHRLHGQSSAQVLQMMSDAGLVNATHIGKRRTLFGPVAFHRANRL
jgi:ubiquinone/menaquinone biosynthesis C-methylase UbiE